MPSFRRYVPELAAAESALPVGSNPPDDGRSGELKTVHFIAAERDRAAQSRMDPRVPAERKGAADETTVEELYAAGRDLGLDGYELERFVENAGSWA
jgi:hypothetical protein